MIRPFYDKEKYYVDCINACRANPDTCESDGSDCVICSECGERGIIYDLREDVTQHINIHRGSEQKSITEADPLILGFTDCGRINNRRVFQFYQGSTNLFLIHECHKAGFQIKDGRADVEKVYYEGEIEDIRALFSLFIRFSHNLLSQSPNERNKVYF